MGSTNFFDGTVASTTGDTVTVTLSNGQTMDGTMAHALSPDQPVSVSVRPEQIHLSTTASEGSLEVTVLNRIFLGEHTEYLVRHEELGEFLVLAPRLAELNEGPFNSGDVLQASWDAGAALVLENT